MNRSTAPLRGSAPARPGLGLLLAVLLGGCSSPAPAPEAWEMKGSRVIGCCCSAPCPCRINRKPTHCHGCDATVACRIDSGHVGDVDLSGVVYVLTSRTIGDDPSRNWVYVYVSDRCTDRQIETLNAFFEGQIKELGAKAKHLIGRLAGMRKVPIRYEVSADGLSYSISIPGILDFRTKAIILPGHKEPVVTTGIFDDYGDRFVHAEAVAHRYDDRESGYAYDLTGRQANQATYELSASRAEKGGLGWACFSGHTELGNAGKHDEQVTGEDPK